MSAGRDGVKGDRKDVDQERLFRAVKRLDRQLFLSVSEDERPTGLKIRAPQHDTDDYLAVVTQVNSEGGYEVGFHGASSLSELLVGLSNRLDNGSVKWHEDKYATKRA